jgi:hypothetical protein
LICGLAFRKREDLVATAVIRETAAPFRVYRAKRAAEFGTGVDDAGVPQRQKYRGRGNAGNAFHPDCATTGRGEERRRQTNAQERLRECGKPGSILYTAYPWQNHPAPGAFYLHESRPHVTVGGIYANFRLRKSFAWTTLNIENPPLNCRSNREVRHPRQRRGS